MGRRFLRRPLFVVLVVGTCCVLSAAGPAFGQDPEPATTIPAEPGGGGGSPNPDPAPEPQPPPPPAQPSSPPPATPSPPPPAIVAPPPAPPVTAGPTPEEIARQEARQRERERRRAAEAERRRKLAIREIRASIKREAAEGYGIPGTLVWPPAAAQPEDTPPVEPAASLDAQPAASPAREAVTPLASTSPASSSGSMLGSAGPILLGLLLLAVGMLVLAALPSRSVSGGLTSIVDQRRLEIGLIGTTVLAAAVIGLLVALISR
jgi:hypothetical protein